MNITENSSGGFHVTLKKSAATNSQKKLSIPGSAVVLRETTTYLDLVTGKQYVVTTEADEFDRGRFNGQRL